MPQDKKVYKFLMCLYKGRILQERAIFYILVETENGKPVREVRDGLQGNARTKARITDPGVLNAYFGGMVVDGAKVQVRG